ncbi:MAG: hypothetical protein ACR2IS_06610 [Nitrososphaeraceae archaeon]
MGEALSRIERITMWLTDEEYSGYVKKGWSKYSRRIKRSMKQNM